MATSSIHDYYTAPVGEPLKSSDAAGLHANVKSNKKQVSFHRDEKLVAVSHSHRSIDSDASKDSSKDHSPASSCRSYGSTGYTTVSLPSLHESLVRTQRHRDPYRYYEVIKVLGDGSMGSVSKVKKRKSAIGGSARRTFVEEESRHHRATQENTFLYRCFSFCIPGMAEKDKEDAFVSTYDHGHSNGTGNGSGGSHESSGATSAVSALTGDSSSRYYETTNGNGTTDTTYDTNSQRKATKKRYKKASSIISYTGEKNVVYALKTIILERVKDATFRKELLNEITILRSIDHPNIVRAIETYDYHHRLYLVLELCSGGDLYARDPYDEQQAKAIVYMILDAVAYLHSKDLVHRDLKYENICFASPTSPAIKLIDFGLSKKYIKEESMSETVGTVYTMSPEVIKGSYDEKCDVWSIGVMAFMLLSSSLPFYGKSRSHVVRKILHNKYGFKGKRWKNVSDQSKAFVTSLLVTDVKERPTAAQAMQHEWFQEEFGSNDHQSIISSAVMDRVQASIETFAGYSRLKKLALYVIAHKSTDEEIGFLRRLFLRRFDIEKSTPDISYPEFKEALSVYNYSHEDLVRMFIGMDIDGTGKVSYSEFLAATIEAHGSIEEERIAEAFDRLDEDDTGFVTAENLRSFLGDEIAEDVIDEILDEADTDQDGQISYEEFLDLWDEDMDEILRQSLKEVEKKRTRRETIFAARPSNTRSFDSIDASSYSMDSNEETPADHYFAKEKEKSLRGVWV